MFAGPIPYVPILLSLVAFAAFLVPGFCWASWLHREDRFGWPVRCALGFAWSFALFGLLSGPFLWFSGTWEGFLSLLYPAWTLFMLLGGSRCVLYRRAEGGQPQSGGEGLVSESAPAPSPRSGRRALLLLAAYLGVLPVAAWTWGAGQFWGQLGVILGAPLLLVAGFLAARRFQSAAGPLLKFTPEDDTPAPRLWVALAALLILLQALSSVVYDRPDWDDGFYLSVVRDYSQGGVLNTAGMPIIYRTLCWELWGAVLCHLSGLNSLALFHSVLPGLLVLLAYGAYTGLVSEYLPRRWVPLALLGLSGYFLWGISGHLTAANHLLPRPWQGKSVLLHIAVPLGVLLLTRYAGHPDWRRWLGLAACLVFGLAASLSALFMGAALVLCLSLALIPAIPGRRVRFLAGLALSSLPVLVGGLVIWLALRQTAEKPDGLGLNPFSGQTWIGAVIFHFQHGSAEILFVLSLPLLAAFLGDRRRKAYLVTLPCLLALTFANPLWRDWVAAHLTTHHTYYRLWWLLPVGPGLAILLALVARFLSRMAPARGSVLVPLTVTFTGLATTFALPGIFVWSPRNSFIGPLGTPHLAENLEKMPGDLVPLAHHLIQAGDCRGRPLLCNEEVASFLAPYAGDFQFIKLRNYPYVGGPVELLEGNLLVLVLRIGRLPKQLGREDRELLTRSCGQEAAARVATCLAEDPANYVRDMLGRLRIRYVITAPGDRPGLAFARAGYKVVCLRGDFTLWQASEASYPLPPEPPRSESLGSTLLPGLKPVDG